MDRGVWTRGLGALVLGAALVACRPGTAVAQGPTPAPGAGSVLDVRAANSGVPIQLRGSLHGFGLTPFQLRDMPAGQYVVQVRQGEYEGGASRLTVRRTPDGTRFEVGSVRGKFLLESALLPGLGHFQAGAAQRGGSALAQTVLAAAQTWNVHSDYADAAAVESQALSAYRAERDAENLASRRSTLRDAEAAAADLRSQQQRWLGVTAWAYASNLLDLFWDTGPVATLQVSPDGGRSLDVRARPTSRSLALLRGAVHPGSGHYALNHRWRGLAFEVLSSAGVYACVLQQGRLDEAKRHYTSAHSRYLAASEDELGARRATMQSAYTGWSEARDRRDAALIGTGATWVLGLLDVLWSEPARTPPEFEAPRRVGLSLRPAPAGIVGQLGARF